MSLEGIEQEISGAIKLRAHEPRLDAATAACNDHKWSRSDVGNLGPREVFDVASVASNGDTLPSNEIAAVIAPEPDDPENRSKKERKTNGTLEGVVPRMAADDARKKSASATDPGSKQE